MATDITIRVPDELGRRLDQFRDRLPEVLERGLRDLQAENSPGFADEQAVVRLLASRPTPEQVLALAPSPKAQARLGELLDRSKDGTLSRAEELELERLLLVEHLVRLAKARALEQLPSGE
jgi:hypothetical protein